MNYDGIFNKIATNYGVNTFTNPITSGEVKLRFSDDFCNESCKDYQIFDQCASNTLIW